MDVRLLRARRVRHLLNTWNMQLFAHTFILYTVGCVPSGEIWPKDSSTRWSSDQHLRSHGFHHVWLAITCSSQAFWKFVAAFTLYTLDMPYWPTVRGLAWVQSIESRWASTSPAWQTKPPIYSLLLTLNIGSLDDPSALKKVTIMQKPKGSGSSDAEEDDGWMLFFFVLCWITFGSNAHMHALCLVFTAE